MKNIVKIKLAFVVVALCLLFSCKKSADNVIAIVQFGPSAEQNEVADGIRSAIKELLGEDSKYVIEHYDCSFDRNTLEKCAQKLVDRKVRVIVPIGESASVECATAAHLKDVPVIYSCVADESVMKRWVNVSGVSTSDVLEKELELISMFFSSIPSLRIGVVLSENSPGSDFYLKNLQDLGNRHKMMIRPRLVSSIQDVKSATYGILDNKVNPVNCILIVDDDCVMAASDVLIETAEQFGIPVFGNSETQVAAGALAACAIDFRAVGRATGEKVVNLLKGSYIRNLSYSFPITSLLVYNKQAAEGFYQKRSSNVTKPADLSILNEIQPLKIKE